MKIQKDEFTCPECGYSQYCPCESCKDLLPENKKPWEWIHGELIKCANCGLTNHCDWWLDAECKWFEMMKKEGKVL